MKSFSRFGKRKLFFEQKFNFFEFFSLFSIFSLFFQVFFLIFSKSFYVKTLTLFLTILKNSQFSSFFSILPYIFDYFLSINFSLKFQIFFSQNIFLDFLSSFQVFLVFFRTRKMYSLFNLSTFHSSFFPLFLFNPMHKYFFSQKTNSYFTLLISHFHSFSHFKLTPIKMSSAKSL